MFLVAVEVEGPGEQQRRSQDLDPEGDLERPLACAENHDYNMVWCGRRRSGEDRRGEESCGVVWMALVLGLNIRGQVKVRELAYMWRTGQNRLLSARGD